MRKRVLIGALCALAAAMALSINENPLSAWNSGQCDFTTGGGFIVNPTVAGGKGTFGVAGGCKHGALWGHLEYHDHGAGLKAHGIEITGYFPDNVFFTKNDPYARLICGTATTYLGEVDFVVRVKDGGEPGKGKDEFDILWKGVGGAYTTFGTAPHKLAGGSIQLHKPNKSNTGMFGGTCPALPETQSTQDFTLTVDKFGNAAAETSITSVPPGIDCGTTCTATFTGTTTTGITIELRAVGPTDRRVNIVWQDGCDFETHPNNTTNPPPSPPSIGTCTVNFTPESPARTVTVVINDSE